MCFTIFNKYIMAGVNVDTIRTGTVNTSTDHLHMINMNISAIVHMNIPKSGFERGNIL